MPERENDDEDEEDSDDDDDVQESSVRSGVQVVSAWLMPQSSTIEDLCAMCRGSEAVRTICSAEVLNYIDILACGGDVTKARLEGFVLSRNKGYILEDGDIVSSFVL